MRLARQAPKNKLVGKYTPGACIAEIKVLVRIELHGLSSARDAKLHSREVFIGVAKCLGNLSWFAGAYRAKERIRRDHHTRRVAEPPPYELRVHTYRERIERAFHQIQGITT